MPRRGSRLLTTAAGDLDRYAGQWGAIADREWVAEGSHRIEQDDRARAMSRQTPPQQP